MLILDVNIRVILVEGSENCFCIIVVIIEHLSLFFVVSLFLNLSMVLVRRKYLFKATTKK